MAARKRRSASSRSSTWRNCSCSRIQPDLDVGAGGEAFAIVTDDYESIRASGGREQRCTADRERLDRIAVDLHSRIVQAANRRTDLASQPAAQRAIRPLLRASAERPNG